MVINISVKFRENISNGLQLTRQIRFLTDRLTGGQTNVHGKINISPEPDGGRHKKKQNTSENDIE